MRRSISNRRVLTSEGHEEAESLVYTPNSTRHLCKKPEELYRQESHDKHMGGHERIEKWPRLLIGVPPQLHQPTIFPRIFLGTGNCQTP